jgi:hypothetical protein
MPHERTTPAADTLARACPRCGSTALQAEKLWRPATLHDLLNPALAFNELALGQREPRVTLVCRQCADHPAQAAPHRSESALQRASGGKSPPIRPQRVRRYVPCPHCDAMHPASLWLAKNAFGNWLGLVCPACLRRIPCRWNVASLVLLLLTFPLWYVPYRFCFRDRPARAPLGEAQARLSPRASLFLLSATLFGAALWLVLVALPVFMRYFSEGRLDGARLMLGTGICSFVAIAFGGLMLLFVTDEELGEEPAKDQPSAAAPPVKHKDVT